VKQASELIGVEWHTLRDLELGRRKAYYPTLYKIAGGYGVPVEELLEEPAPLAEAPSASPETTGPGHVEVLPPATSVEEAARRLEARDSLALLRMILQVTDEERLHGFIEEREEDAARQVAEELHRLGISREQAHEAALLISEPLAKDFEVFKEAHQESLANVRRRKAGAADKRTAEASGK